MQRLEHGSKGNAIQLMEGIQTHCIAILGHNDRSFARYSTVAYGFL
jgi:hypothetical protein